MGNICRSPTAHAVFQRKVAEHGLTSLVSVDSAGTHNYHPGSPPDGRSQVHAMRRGYDLSPLRARQISGRDFEIQDLILVMDWDNLSLAQSQCPGPYQNKIRRLTEFSLRRNSTVIPDPYYGGANGFDEVLDLVEDACDGLIAHVRRQLSQPERPI